MDAWVKRRDGAPPGLFAAEAAGLRWLQVPGGTDVVQVLDVTERTISLTRVTPVTPTRAAAEAFGESLARTHSAGAAAFGASPDGFNGQCYIADLPLPTTPEPAWGVFYAKQRVLHFAAQAAAELGAPGLKVMHALSDRLLAGDFDDDSLPARLHGDLWAGNVLYGATGAVLIDPSAHGGHRLTDLAMLCLFGTPHLEAVLDAYECCAPELPTDWRSLISLHQVYPLLVHTVLFGGGYAGEAVAAAWKYVSGPFIV